MIFSWNSRNSIISLFLVFIVSINYNKETKETKIAKVNVEQYQFLIHKLPPHWSKLFLILQSCLKIVGNHLKAFIPKFSRTRKIRVKTYEEENQLKVVKCMKYWTNERESLSGRRNRSGLDDLIGRTGDRLGVSRDQPLEEHGWVYKRALTRNPRWLLSCRCKSDTRTSSSWKQKSAGRTWKERRDDDKSRLWEARESPGKPATVLDGRRDHTLTSTPTFWLPIAPI